MRDKLDDLQFLYLACRIEDTFEGLERGFEKHLSPLLREQIKVLFEPGANHKRLEQELADRNHALADVADQVSAVDLLKAIRDCERMAHDFYERYAPRLSDPALQRLFRGMAAEELSHMQAAERALAMASGKT